MDSVRIMLAAFSADDKKAAAGLLQDETLRIVCSMRPDKDGLKKAGTQPADVLLLCTTAIPEVEFDFAERMYTSRSDVTILLMTPKPSPEDVMQAMECGIARVIDMNSPVDEIKTAIITAASRDQYRRSSIAKVATYDSRIIQFFSAKGGVGKTTLAVNMACALASQNKKVADRPEPAIRRYRRFSRHSKGRHARGHGGREQLRTGDDEDVLDPALQRRHGASCKQRAGVRGAGQAGAHRNDPVDASDGVRLYCPRHGRYAQRLLGLRL